MATDIKHLEKNDSPASEKFSDGSNEKLGIERHVEDNVTRDAIAYQTGGIIPPPDLQFTQEEEDRVHRKIDYRLLPIVFVLYSFAVLDRSNLGNAKLAGLEDDIDLGGWRYNWLGTIFYIACTSTCFYVQPLPLPSSCLDGHTLTSWFRHLLAMDSHGLEEATPAHLCRLCRLLLGFCCHHPGYYYQLVWSDDLSLLPWCF
jgi:hypothetical protein